MWTDYPRQVCSSLQIFHSLVFVPRDILLFISPALIKAGEILFTLTRPPIKGSCNINIYGTADNKAHAISKSNMAILRRKMCFFGPAEVFFLEAFTLFKWVPGCNQKNSDVIQIGTQKHWIIPPKKKEPSSNSRKQWITSNSHWVIARINQSHLLLSCMCLRAYCCVFAPAVHAWFSVLVLYFGDELLFVARAQNNLRRQTKGE